MTFQLRLTVFYENEEYELLGDSSGQLFFPRLFGMDTCGSGTNPKYRIENEKFFLETIEELFISDSRTLSDYPIVNGVSPTIRGNGFYVGYSELMYLMPISSTVFICKKVVANHEAPYLKISDYAECLRITVENGMVVGVDDISNLCAEIRNQEQSLIEEKFKIAREQGISFARLFLDNTEDELRGLSHEVEKISLETYF